MRGYAQQPLCQTAVSIAEDDDVRRWQCRFVHVGRLFGDEEQELRFFRGNDSRIVADVKRQR